MSKLAARSTPGKLADQAARDVIRGALDETVFVEAAAGTGKTTELVGRIVAILAQGRASVDTIVAVTFTEKAAGEIKLRVREGLELERQRHRRGSEPYRNLEEALSRLEEAWVGTIHGFCAELLRERSLDAEVDPQFEVMAEADAERLFSETFRRWLEQTLHDPQEGVKRSLRRRGGADSDPVERLRKAAWTLAGWRDFTAPWRRDPFDRATELRSLERRVHEFAELTERCALKDRDQLYADLEPARALSRELAAAEEVGLRDDDGLEAALIELPERRAREQRAPRGSRPKASAFRQPRPDRGRSYGPGLERDAVQAAHRGLLEALEDFTARANADLAALLQSELRGAIERYEDAKRRLGRLDFVDLLIRARDLVRDRPAVRAEFQRRFTHFFVDEFQDTDPVQAEILMLLAGSETEEPDWERVTPVRGKLFVVGDPKQSIYRFRRADLGVYARVKQRLVEHAGHAVELTASFRAVPSLQHAVNAAFAPLLDGDPESLQASYVPLSPVRRDASGQPSLVALPVPEPYGRTGVTKGAITASLPRAVGAFIDWMVHESGWTVTERDSATRVKVAARHVCILFRRREDFFAEERDVTRPYARELEARGIRHLMVGSRSFHERAEVEALRTALAAIEWPDDELSLFATLRGPLFAVGDEELLEYRHAHGRLHPFRRPRGGLASHLEPIGAALGLLAGLHRERNRRTLSETLQRLLQETRAHAGFVFQPAGEQVLANVLHLAEQARAFEMGGGTSFRAFVERLMDEAESRKTSEASILEEGTDGVRMMTVHQAKGLEFPVVILADMTAVMAHGRPSLHIDPRQRLCAVRIGDWSPAELLDHQASEHRRERAEGVRLAYVAATRARDLLVVPAIGDGPWGDGDPHSDRPGFPTWFAPLNRALYPNPPSWSSPRLAPGCPAFGDDATLARPDERCAGGVRPGLHAIPGSSHEVVWWDPRSLPLETPPTVGIRKEELIEKAVEPVSVDEDAARHHEWRRRRAEWIESASVPSARVVQATAYAARGDVGPGSSGAAAEPIELEWIELAREAGRPAGARFGTLVHAVLAAIPLDADAERIRAMSALQGRILAAHESEVSAAATAVRAVLAHPLLSTARAAERRGECRREIPLTYRDLAGTIVDGQADLAFADGAHWWVVDFKTDGGAADHAASHRRQVEHYARVIAEVTGRPTRAVVMRV